MTSAPDIRGDRSDSWRAFAKALARAFAIGLVAFVPIASVAWQTTRPTAPLPPTHHLILESATPPANDDVLRTWVERRPGVSAVATTRNDRPAGVTRVDVSWCGPGLEPGSVPWAEIAYPKPTSSMVMTIDGGDFHVDLGIGYYASLLAICANLGFLVLGIGALRRSGRAGQLLARPTFRRVGSGVATGVGLGVLALLWARVPWVGGSVAGAAGATMFWPAWGRWVLLLLLPIALPIAQEPFFRGAEQRPWLVTSCVFALVHLYPPTFLPALAMGVACAWLRRTSGSLWSPMIANGCFYAASVSVPLLCGGSMRAWAGG